MSTHLPFGAKQLIHEQQGNTENLLPGTNLNSRTYSEFAEQVADKFTEVYGQFDFSESPDINKDYATLLSNMLPNIMAEIILESGPEKFEKFINELYLRENDEYKGN